VCFAPRSTGSPMAERSEISWTDSTHNFWIGCQNVSEGCRNCYAERLADRYGWAKWGPHEARHRTGAANWRKPLAWHSAANRFQRAHNRRQRVFASSLSDVFDNRVPPAWRVDMWRVIRDTPDLDWLLLTKRPGNIARMLPPDWGDGWPHVWLGATTEDQATFDQRWPVLARTPAVVRFISYEPAIGPLRLPESGPLPDWIIFGAESGPGARDADLAWARDVFHDAHGRAAVFAKQLSGPGGNAIKDLAAFPADLRIRQFPASAAPVRFAGLPIVLHLPRLFGPDDSPDDDEEIDTPASVVAMLGFDPREA
jgi:protein gp37